MTLVNHLQEEQNIVRYCNLFETPSWVSRTPDDVVVLVPTCIADHVRQMGRLNRYIRCGLGTLTSHASLGDLSPTIWIFPDRMTSFLQDDQNCLFGEVADGATLVGFTGDDVCIPAAA